MPYHTGLKFNHFKDNYNKETLVFESNGVEIHKTKTMYVMLKGDYILSEIFHETFAKRHKSDYDSWLNLTKIKDQKKIRKLSDDLELLKKDIDTISGFWK